MKTNDALSYIVEKAIKLGYTHEQVSCFLFELRERISEMPECDEDDIEKLFLDLF